MRSQYNFVTKDSDLETLKTDDCRTVPNMALSVKEILRRFNSGTLPDDLSRNYYDYEDDDIDSPVIEFKDLTDLTEMSEKQKQVIEKVKTESKANSSSHD